MVPKSLQHQGQLTWLEVKQLSKDPWKNIEKKYKIGKIYSGKINKIVEYGAFIELEDGIEGLIHISEMSWVRHIKHPSDMFQPGDKVSAKILNIDEDEKKISTPPKSSIVFTESIEPRPFLER